MNAQAAGGTGTVGVLPGTTPTAGQVQLVALSGTLPATVGTTNTWMVSWAGGTVAPPAQCAIAPATLTTGTATTATFNCAGAIIAGAIMNWVLY